MSKLDEKAAALFGRDSQATNFKEGFETMESAPTTADFRQLFSAPPLTVDEDKAIHSLLHEGYTQNTVDDHDVEIDYKMLASITQQIRAIDRQGILLHGERIKKARDLLKKYRDGAFTSWLHVAYGNRQTPYRMLHFYELFSRLAREDRQLFEKMPKKAAYSLAMREGAFNKKIEIIRKHYSQSTGEISAVIETHFPLAKTDRRKEKDSDETILKILEDGIKRLSQKKDSLSDIAKVRLAELAKEIAAIL